MLQFEGTNHIGRSTLTVTEYDKQTAELMKQDMIRLQRVSEPVLQAYGIPEETVKAWVDGGRDELVNLRKHLYCQVSLFPASVLFTSLLIEARLDPCSILQWLFTWAVKHQSGSDS